MKKDKEKRRKPCSLHLGPPFIRSQKKFPALMIWINQILYLLTLFLLLLGGFRLCLHLFLGLSLAPPELLFRGALAILLLIILWFRKLKITIIGIVFVIVIFIVPHGPDSLILTAYRALSDWCYSYAKSENLKNIFMAMGIINFSFGYVISVRDKHFLGVPLGNVIQEQFPTHGYTFVLYTCLTLIGLYSCGMDFNIVALVCLLGALLAFVSTSIMAVLFTFSHQLKQYMVEYYLCCSPYVLLVGRRTVEQDIKLNRTLAAADYIKTYYQTNGTVPQVAFNLWYRIYEDLKDAPVVDTVGSRGSRTHTGDNFLYTQSIAYAAAAWRHMLGGLSPEQQGELVCFVLRASLSREDTLLEQCRQFLHGGSAPEMSRRSSVPLCGFVAYLRSTDTLSLPSEDQYWSSCRRSLNAVYRIYLLYPGVTPKDSPAHTDAIPRFLFLLLETVLLIEMSALERDSFKNGTDFWRQLTELENVLQVTFMDCSWFSEWGLDIVCSYKVDWFRSHQGMLEAYLTYQRLFDLIDEHNHAGLIDIGKENNDA